MQTADLHPAPSPRPWTPTDDALDALLDLLLGLARRHGRPPIEPAPKPTRKRKEVAAR